MKIIIILLALTLWACDDQCETGEGECHKDVLRLCDDYDHEWFSAWDCRDIGKKCVEDGIYADCEVVQ